MRVNVVKWAYLIVALAGALLPACSRAQGKNWELTPQGKIKVVVSGYHGHSTIAPIVESAVVGRLNAAQRFIVSTRSDLQVVMDERRLVELFGDPRAARGRRKMGSARYVLIGKVLGAECPVTKNTSYNKKRKRYDTTYSATARVTVEHRVIDVVEGTLMASETKTGSATNYSSDSYPNVDNLARSAAADAAKNIERLFTATDKRGRVTNKMPDGQVMVNLGSMDGVGMDVDLVPYRRVYLTDANGQPIMQGRQKMSRLERFGSEKDPDKLLVIRPVKIEADYTIGEVGYYKDGFLRNGFRKSEHHYATIQKDDIVKTDKRPEGK